MRIEKLLLRNYNQFKRLELDFGSADKICFIGPNGTGKSTILALINGSLGNLESNPRIQKPFILAGAPHLLMRVALANERVYLARILDGSSTCVLPADAEAEFPAFFDDGDATARLRLDYQARPLQPEQLHDVRIFSGMEGTSRLETIKNMPRATLNDALAMYREFPKEFVVNIEKAADFWRLLIFLVKQRDSDFQQFLREPRNQAKTVEEATREFSQSHPEILPAIAKLWDDILADIGLKFDVEHARIPVQLSDNLVAHIKVIRTGADIPYNALSTGIRHFIFRLGYLFAIYFGREIKSGFLFLDEPENSLYPTLLYDLVDRYVGIARNTQIFMATHNPIIAAQFRPEERVLLNFDDDAYVTAHHGVAPEGDDPNDLLKQDFAVESVYPRAGIEQWERFLELRRAIKSEKDGNRKLGLMQEFLSLGARYGFDVNEISAKT